MDDFDAILTRVLERIAGSGLPDKEKAELYVQIQAGMRKLILPILLAHVPEYELKHVMAKSELTMDEYARLMEISLSNPATSKELHDELVGAIGEVEQLLIAKLPAGKV